MKHRLRHLIEMLRCEYLLISAVIFGGVLRLYQLPGQILFGDEWHAVFAATHLTAPQILSTFGLADHCIPVALYYKLAIHSIGLDELVIRMPFFVAGTLTVLVLPLMIRSLAGRFTSNLFAWLLALSPPLIFYSRIARPYSIAVLCGFSAVIIFFRWWMRPDWRLATTYVILASATAYFLLVTLPWVLGPFLFFFASSLMSPCTQPFYSIKRLALLGFFTLLAIALCVGPPLYFDSAAILNKAGHLVIRPSDLAEAFGVLSGMASPLPAIILFLFIIAGLIKVYREKPTAAIYLFALSLLQPAALLIVRPLGSGTPIIFARYMLLILPALLIFAAAGVEAIPTGFGRLHMKWLRPALSVALCAVFFLEGPLPSAIYRPNAATSLVMLLHTLKGDRYQQVLKRVPQFYVNIAAYPPASLTVAECPFHWQADHLPLYQKIHRQNIVMGLTGNLCGQKDKNGPLLLGHATRFKTIVDLKDIDVLPEKGVDFVVFHKQMENEVQARLPDYVPRDISRCIERYRTRFGSPFFEDKDIIVFDVRGG